ncbi:nuclear transport factor 2 family protein [Vibrio sp. SCSIO 43136]|uniref:nuclear transport factor 2 family protein n=1 Tax=Vibrio sp. SCSIO 43136 TaxID=2819101 RepID=UPI002075E910|nr:nuclear transport factor 2 family protein [Vibrio sp. SCSIO 43136]USD67200.1 nuclear transport factor 2 family protein [Vibrio sp. SCSIO 43136]
MLRIVFALVLGVATMTTHAKPLTLDEAKISLTAQSMATLADRNLYPQLEQIFAPIVVVDYTSAFGGEVNNVKREDLMASWSALLPGFDGTYHDLSKIIIDQEGDRAEVYADVTASHYIGDNGFWQISGRYLFEMKKAGTEWQIAALTLLAGDELGSREVLPQAIEAAKSQ